MLTSERYHFLSADHIEHMRSHLGRLDVHEFYLYPGLSLPWLGFPGKKKADGP